VFDSPYNSHLHRAGFMEGGAQRSARLG
jgi:hypothetical protein